MDIAMDVAAVAGIGGDTHRPTKSSLALVKPSSTVLTTSLLDWNTLPGIFTLNCCAAVTFLAAVLLLVPAFALVGSALASLLGMKSLAGLGRLKSFPTRTPLGAGAAVFLVTRAVMVDVLRLLVEAGERDATARPRIVEAMVDTVGVMMQAMVVEELGRA